MKRKILVFIALIGLHAQSAFAEPKFSHYNGQVFDDDCAPESRLKVIYVPYQDFNGDTQWGTVKTLDTIASSLVNTFHQLYKMGYEINVIDSHLVSEGEDKSNTYSFECRNITGGSLPSLHAYGGAIDLNPRENPYIHFSNIENTENYKPDYVIPESGWQYITRDRYREGKPVHKGIITTAVVDIFKENGILRWGGGLEYPY